MQGFIIGAAGSILGLLGAFLALTFRNDIVLWLASIMQNDETLSRFYYFTEIPARTEIIDLGLIVGATLLIVTLAGILPAIRVMRLKPSEALRNE